MINFSNKKKMKTISLVIVILVCVAMVLGLLVSFV